MNVKEAAQQGGIEEKVLNDLIDISFEGKENAYCAYSKFRVGCGILGDNGKMYRGANVENASYGLTICAERTAICAAAADGMRGLEVVVVTSDIEDDFCSPCGACRQFLVEFGNPRVYFVRPDRKLKMWTARELLPAGFDPTFLEKKKVDISGNGKRKRDESK